MTSRRDHGGAGAGRAFARLALVCAPALLFAAAVSARDFMDGPPPAHTGGFAEPTCRACHADYPLNDGGTLAIEGAPPAYEPGRSYTLRIVLRHPELRRAGFQLSARFASGQARGRQAGTLRAADETASVVSEGDVSYAQHTRRGTTVAAPGEHAWTVHWIAPADASADVVLHVAANAANDDFSEFGDRIHTASVTIARGK